MDEPTLQATVQRKTFSLTAVEIQNAVNDLMKLTAYPLNVEDLGDLDKLINQNIQVKIPKSDLHESELVYEAVIEDVIVDYQDGARKVRIHALERLGQTQLSYNKRIFQNLAPSAIVKEVLKAYSISSSKWSLRGQEEKLPYKVQYDESDYNFIARLLNDHGIFYLYRTQEKQLVFTDELDLGVKSQPVSLSLKSHEKYQTLFRWEKQLKRAEEDLFFHALHPEDNKQTSQGKSSSRLSFNEISPQGNASVQKRFQYRNRAEKMQGENYLGQTDMLGLDVGSVVRLKDSPESSENTDYYITDIHTLYDLSNSPKTTFRAAKRDTKLARIIPVERPVVPGLEIASVVGKNEHEVHAQNGQVKVEFHWDSRDMNKTNKTLWVSVLQQANQHFLPRAGDRVLVSFLSGNPDLPVVIGLYYNEAIPPAVKDGGLGVLFFPELGSDGKEAQNSKKFNKIESSNEKNKQSLLIHSNQDLSLQVGKNLNTQVEEEAIVQIKKKANVEVKEETQVESPKMLIKAQSLKLSGTSVEFSHTEQFKAHSSSGEIVLEGRQITLSGTTGLTLKVGPNKIELSPSGITISGIEVNLTGEGSTEVKSLGRLSLTSQGLTQISGLITKIDAETMGTFNSNVMLKLQGTITMIN